MYQGQDPKILKIRGKLESEILWIKERVNLSQIQY